MFNFLNLNETYQEDIFERINLEINDNNQLIRNEDDSKITITIEKIEYISGEYRYDLVLEFEKNKDQTYILKRKDIIYYENFLASRFFNIFVPYATILGLFIYSAIKIL